MGNHIHILATPSREGSLSRMMQWTAARYTFTYNDVRMRTGTLWEGRFFSSAVTSERYFLVCQRYIELNPVRAGMASDPIEHRWSSYAHNALGSHDRLVTEHELYRRLGPTATERCTAYRALFRHELPDADLAAIRSAVNSRVCLGDPPGNHAVSRKRGRPRKASAQSQMPL
jgi:putative transposase